MVENMENEILFADKQYRNRFYFILIGLLIILSLTIEFLLPALIIQLHKFEPEKAMKAAATVLFFLFLVPLPLGFKFLSISNRILREDKYPPENMKVIRDTIILHGEKAKLRAYIFLLLAFLIFFICIFCAFSAQIFLKILITTGRLQ
jgi:hypothetical protein